MEFDNFLAGLKKQEHKSCGTASRHPNDIFFLIGHDEQGGATLCVVDKKMRPAMADHRNFTGDTAVLLRSIDRIRERDTFRVEWGTDNADDKSCVSLKDYPQLMFQLIRCKNVIADDGKPVGTSDETTHAVMHLSAADNTTVIGCL